MAKDPQLLKQAASIGLAESTGGNSADDALRRARDYAENLIQTASVMIIGLDVEGGIQVFNKTAERITGYTRGELVGQNWFELLVPRNRYPAVWTEFSRLLAGGLPKAFENPILTKTGEERLISWRNNEVVEQGKIVGTISFGIDLTERQAMERALAASAIRFRRLFETAQDGVLVIDARTGVVTDANPALTRLLECPREEVVGRRLLDIPLFSHSEDCLAMCEQTGHQDGLFCQELVLTTKSGRQCNLEVVSSACRAGDETVIQCHLRDITLRKQAETLQQRAQIELERRVEIRTAELSAANRALELEITERKRAQKAHLQVLRRLVNAQETERRRVSRELHDQMGQELTALKLGLKVFRAQGALCPAPLRPCIEQLEQLADGLMRNVHRLAWELRPVALDDFGLVVALERYLREWSEHSLVPVDFHCTGIDRQRLPPELETTLYRVTQEALTNVFRHAGAKRVSVLLERRADQVSLIVEDDGQGFEAAIAFAAASSKGKMGLVGMRERVLLVGGKIEIESSPGAGTTVFVRIPLEMESALA